MIAIDTSAIVAIALREPEARAFSETIGAEQCVIGWPTVLESHIVLAGVPRNKGLEVLAKVLAAPRIEIVAFDSSIFDAARDAFDRFGRGRHAAKLNYGDCMSYAVAKARDVALLYKGTDFGLTDIRPALL